jgi:hypothetical protein
MVIQRLPAINLMDKDRRRKALVAALSALTPEMRERLEELKRTARENLQRDDFIWHHLLQSFATMGNSRGWFGLIGDPTNYEEVTFEALDRVAPAVRPAHLDRVLRRSKVRMPSKKAEWLAANFETVQEMGGPVPAKEKALACPGKEAKVEFLKQFDGIGPKYGRNIWMDVYHPDFHNAIAVDERIKGISSAMGYSFKSYRDHERFYLDIVDEAGLSGWETDRLLYNFRSHFEQSVTGDV